MKRCFCCDRRIWPWVKTDEVKYVSYDEEGISHMSDPITVCRTCTSTFQTKTLGSTDGDPF